MTATADPLSRLVVDEAAVDRELLATILEDKVRLDLGRGAFTFQQGVRTRLNNRHQVLVALLAQKALHLLAEQYPEALQPKGIEQLTGVKPGTLRPILRQFNEDRLVRQDGEGAYYIPGYALENVARVLNGRGD